MIFCYNFSIQTQLFWYVSIFELPNVSEDYVHRIGRTGRAGNSGEAISLVCIDEKDYLRDIEKLIKKDIPKIEIEGFKPDPTIKAENPDPRKNNSRGNGNRQKRNSNTNNRRI
jgi:ATP-dependent RNA helicase RhlE